MDRAFPAAADVATLRAFNRAYTRRLGLLNERLDDSAFSLTEARILYELAHLADPTAADIGRKLGLDRGQLSRTLKRFRQNGLVEQAISETHARHHLLSLTGEGRAAFDTLERATRTSIGKLLGDLPAADQSRFLDAVRTITQILDSESDRTTGHSLRLRDPQVGDLAWVTHRQAVLYAEEYGWDASYEALVAEILTDFVKSYDSRRERAWIAELNGAIVGSIFLMQSSAPETARLRLLYVEPSARGRGVGQTLVAACIGQARAVGYRKLELWTNSVLVSARRIYEAAGFQLREEAAHRSFGKELIGQTWVLDLGDEDTTPTGARR